ncbi:ABC transporter ATP-binding protein [Rhodocaloribacter litoris]|uniref:ABC transporter ATP-binding protein n=1 Tax=Rhodocaloribacter litoris TaxID=2558931 RepID=UPI001E45A91F|nr:ATP-binding cassette domain-containing protein [Rhodocaloribacter litoris]
MAEDLGHRFGRRILFRRLGFTLEGGQALAVTGANGSGKSTLVRILAGVLVPSRGTVTLTAGGRAIPPAQRPLHVGLVAPYLNVYEGFSARENLAFLARARRLPEAPRRIEAVLEAVELTARADDLVATYSSGMKQRMRFAAALLADPPLLLLDEPTANLDAPGRAMVSRIVAGALAAGRLVVIATNDAGEAAGCSRILCVEDYR